MKPILKGLGVGVGATGLVAYGAFRLLAWPVRSVWRSVTGQRSKALAYSRGPAGPDKPNPFVAAMLMMAAPGMVSIMQRLSRRLMRQMAESASVAEQSFNETMAAAQQQGWMVGPLTDASEELTREADRQIVLSFNVLDARTGDVLSSRGRCRITLDGAGKATRVHSFFETDGGAVHDILLDTDPVRPDNDDDDDGSTKRREVLDAEIVSKKQ